MVGLNPYLNEDGTPKSVTATPPPAPAPPPATGLATPLAGTTPQVDSSVANNVANLISKDSKLNQMARTEGLKTASSRGLLNSSMAIGAAQDAVIRNAFPIASQDASQNFQSAENVAARTWQTVENNAQRGWQGNENQMNRDLEALLQGNQITSAEKVAFANIKSTEGIEAAGRALQLKLQGNALASAATLQTQQLASTERMNKLDIASNENVAKLSRDLQDRIAGMNVKSTDRNSASQAVINFSAQYNARVADILANPNMSASARTTALNAAKTWLSTTLNLTEQLYNVDLTWDRPTPPKTTTTTTPPKTTTTTPVKRTPAQGVAAQTATGIKFGTPIFRNNQWHVTKNGVDMVFDPNKYQAGMGYVP